MVTVMKEADTASRNFRLQSWAPSGPSWEARAQGEKVPLVPES